jgi:hypothetical protein
MVIDMPFHLLTVGAVETQTVRHAGREFRSWIILDGAGLFHPPRAEPNAADIIFKKR